MEAKDEQLPTHENEEKIPDNIHIKDAEWKGEHEVILVEWADKAMCYRWLHGKSHQAYSNTNAWYTIPVIIMSTVTGTANFAQDRFSDEVKPYMQMAIGAVNIFAGILTTIAQFLKVGELNEAHRVSSISWDKFYRNIKVELAKSRKERTNVVHMLKMCKEEFDRLMETSPVIRDSVITSFKSTFKGKENFKFIKKPEICDELISTVKFKFKGVVIEGGDTTKEDMCAQLDEYINTYNSVHGRDPILDEMYDDLDIDNDDIDEFYSNKYSEKESKTKMKKRISRNKKESKSV